MRKSVPISAALHLSVLLWALAVLPSQANRDLSVQPVPVDIISPSEFTKIKAGEKEAEDKPAAPKAEKPKEESKKPAPEPQKEAALPPPPEEKPEPKPESPKPEKAEPKPEEVEAQAKPEPEKPKVEKAEEKAPPKPEPKPEKVEKAKPEKAGTKPEPKLEKPKQIAEDKPKPKSKPPTPKTEKKKEFDADKIAALLNKVPDASPETRKNEEPTSRFSSPSRGMRSGADDTMSMSEIDALRSKISQCWNPPVGGFGEEPIRIKIRMQLNDDGTLTGQPQVINSGSSPFFQAAADSAARAVWQCQPYALPSEKFAQWRDMVLNFDPREMYGG